MNNQIKIIRDKLTAYSKVFIDKELLNKLLTKFAPSYKISDLTLKWLIIPVKRGKSYINTFSKNAQDHFQVGDLYFEWKDYMFGGLGLYNQYWFSAQVVEWHTVYNTTVSWKRIIWKNKFIFKKQIKSFFYWAYTLKYWNASCIIMSPERAFIQFVKDWMEVLDIPNRVNKEKLLIMSKKNASKRVHNIIKNLCS